jgi:hypothetical protein
MAAMPFRMRILEALIGLAFGTSPAAILLIAVVLFLCWSVVRKREE